MSRAQDKVEQMWARQQIAGADVDYDAWAADRRSLSEMARLSGSCIFTVDVYRRVYDFASGGFESLLGIPGLVLQNIDREGDILDKMIHPADRDRLTELRLMHGRFIYGLDPGQRNDYRTIYQWRMRGAGNRYLNVTSRQQVFRTDRNGKAWIVMGMMEPSPDQTPSTGVRCSVLNLKTGFFFNPCSRLVNEELTCRETEILSLVREGFLSKEIAAMLGISINTVSNHRKSILAKLNAANAVEAINSARAAGILD